MSRAKSSGYAVVVTIPGKPLRLLRDHLTCREAKQHAAAYNALGAPEVARSRAVVVLPPR